MLNEMKSVPSGKSATGRKTKLAISLLLGILTLAFVFKMPEALYSPSENTSTGNIVKTAITPPVPLNNISDKFLIGTMDNGIEPDYNILTNGLHLNQWHKYIKGGLQPNGQFQIWGWTNNDLLDADINTYRNDVTGIITQNYNNNMRTLMERPKITRLAFGQRSDYQCETIDRNDPLWFYAYADHNISHSDVYDNDPNYGSNSMVRKCTMPVNGPGSAGWVVTGLKANREQVNMNARWEGDKSYSWFVKPKIRADKDFVNNQLNWQTSVCRIEVINYDNQLIRSVILNARNFLDSSLYYDGKYKEEYRYFANEPTLTFTQPEAVNFNPDGKYWDVPEGICHVDFKVYWYGNCDMWIDYIRVDNDVADGLMNPNSANYTQYNTWLSWEANDIATHTASPIKFYIEEFEFNNLPCMAYVSRKLRGIDPDIGLMCDINYHNYNTMIPFSSWDDPYENFVGVEHIKRFVIDSLGSTEIFMGSYPLGGGKPGGSKYYEQTPIPVTLMGPQSWDWEHGILAQSVSVSAYEDTLQAHFDNQWNQMWSYRNWTARADSLSKMVGVNGIPFINLLQSHLWYSAPDGYNLREPTNEELDLMSNLAISYGARGIFHFWHGSWGCLPSPNDSASYDRGLTNPVPCNNPNPFDNMQSNPQTVTYEPRLTNVYGQPKWDKIIDIDKRLEKWGSTLMNFDNSSRHSYIYRLDDERIDCINETYFRDVASYIWGNDHPICNLDAPDTTDAPPPENLKYECFEDRYLQVATFKTGVNDPNNYFMIVNRRCSPVQPVTHNDGKRYIRVFFDRNSQQLEAFSNWSIIDLASNVVIDVVDIANVTPYADLGWFDPGEGKLYKMVSTVKSGGILAGDEYITGESFTCEAPVYNNGYNITIGANTTIHFNDSSKFVMDGGVFTVGDQNTSAPQNITSDAVPGGSWRGHSFTNCEVKIYGATFTGLANDTTYAVNIIDCPVVDIRNCTFNTNSSLKGGVNAICFNNPFIAINNIYIGSNTFNSSGSTIPTVNVSSYAGVTTPLIIENNTFNEGNTAIFLSGVIGGAIKGNTITDNYIGINALTSSIDVVQNNISSTVSGSMGIFAAGGSELKLNSSGAFTLGGLNSISNEGTGTNNINVDGSYFLLEMAKIYSIFQAIRAHTTYTATSRCSQQSQPKRPITALR